MLESLMFATLASFALGAAHTATRDAFANDSIFADTFGGGNAD